MLVTLRDQRVKYIYIYYIILYIYIYYIYILYIIYIYIYIYILSWLEKGSVRIHCLAQEYTMMALAGKGVPRVHSLRCSPKVQCSN